MGSLGRALLIDPVQRKRYYSICKLNCNQDLDKINRLLCDL